MVACTYTSSFFFFNNKNLSLIFLIKSYKLYITHNEI